MKNVAMRTNRRSLAMRKAAVYRTDRQLPEWLLFLLVSLTSFREAWIKGGTNTYDFFWKAWDGLGYYQWLPSAFIT